MAHSTKPFGRAPSNKAERDPEPQMSPIKWRANDHCQWHVVNICLVCGVKCNCISHYASLSFKGGWRWSVGAVGPVATVGTQIFEPRRPTYDLVESTNQVVKDDLQALRERTFACNLRPGEGAGAEAKAPEGNRPWSSVMRRPGVKDEGRGDTCGSQG